MTRGKRITFMDFDSLKLDLEGVIQNIITSSYTVWLQLRGWDDPSVRRISSLKLLYNYFGILHRGNERVYFFYLI